MGTTCGSSLVFESGPGRVIFRVCDVGLRAKSTGYKQIQGEKKTQLCGQYLVLGLICE